jgi:hypothetical protein
MMDDAVRNNCLGLVEKPVSGSRYDEGIKSHGGCFPFGSHLLVAEFTDSSGKGQAGMAS